jgi:hypothetical protein
MPEILFIHIISASFALAGAYAALFAPKGGALHRRAGLLFVWAMIVMGVAASILSRAKGEAGTAGPMILYLVITAVATMRKQEAVPRWLLPSLMVVALGVGYVHIAGGLLLLEHPRADAPPAAAFITGGLLVLAALGDLRVLLRGPLRGSARLLRHMWRMCYAAFAVTGSFFLGQSDEIPEPLRIWPLLFFLAFLPLMAMLYYFVREGLRRSRKPAKARIYVPATLDVVKASADVENVARA